MIMLPNDAVSAVEFTKCRMVVDKKDGARWDFSCLRSYLDTDLGWESSCGKLHTSQYCNACTEQSHCLYALMFILFYITASLPVCSDVHPVLYNSLTA
jgi:hypothetical protein